MQWVGQIPTNSVLSVDSGAFTDFMETLQIEQQLWANILEACGCQNRKAPDRTESFSKHQNRAIRPAE
jgi:hypothetical protein